METFDIDPDLLTILPPVLIQVVRALGVVRGREFLIQHGGLNVYVSIRSVNTLGVSTVELSRLRTCLKGHLDHKNRVYLPKVDKLINHLRDEHIRREMLKKSISKQATEYKLCVRQVVNIRAGYRSKDADEPKSRKSLTISDAEITTLTRLVKVQLEKHGDSPLLLRVLNKLDRAKIAGKATGTKTAQFDLFR